MTGDDLEDPVLAEAGRRLRRALDDAGPAPPWDQTVAERSGRNRRRRTVAALTAVVVVAGLAAAIGLGRRDPGDQVATDGPGATTTEPSLDIVCGAPTADPSSLGDPIRVQDAVAEAAGGSLRFVQVRPDGVLDVGLAADGMDVAEKLASTYGDLLSVKIGAKRFGVDASGRLARCAGDSPSAVPPSSLPPLPAGFTATVSDGAEGVRTPAGGDVTVRLVLTGDRPWTTTPDVNGAPNAWLVRPGTTEPVSADDQRFSTSVGSLPVAVPAGVAHEITLIATSASADASADPALAPGRYDLVGNIEIDGSLHLSPPVAVEVTNG